MMQKINLKISVIALVYLLFGLMSCSSDTLKIETLKEGDKLGQLTVKEVTSKNGVYTILFKDEIIIDKDLENYESPHRLAVGTDLLKGKLEIAGEEVDLEIYRKVFLRNSNGLDELITPDMLNSGTFKQQMPIKVIVDNITLSTEDGFYASINNILEFNGQRDPKPKSVATAETENVEEQGITLDILKNIQFSGNEPPWTLTFKDNHLEYTLGYNTNIIKMVYYGDHDGSNQKIKRISDKKVQVELIAESALDKGFIWVATIVKENCDDGMSPTIYQYSIKIQEENGDMKGCGRLINNTAKSGDFDSFWKQFQNIIANNNKAAFMKLCSAEMKSYFEYTSYEELMNPRMKKEVAKTSASQIEDKGNQGKLFMYKVITGPENDYTSNYMTYGFWFKKVNGKWIINSPQMGG